MHKKVITIENISVDELVELIADRLKEKISVQDNFEKQSDELLNSKQTAELLNVDQSTIHRWINSGKITCYGIGGKRYFKKEELMNSLVKVKKSGNDFA
jgi:excisionase family DNA binding protein